MTFYNPSVGTGACGPSPVDGHVFQDSEDVVAVIHTMMGSLSSRDLSARGQLNPLCFRRLKIYNPANGKSAVGQVVDKCPGCVSLRRVRRECANSIELTGVTERNGWP